VFQLVKALEAVLVYMFQLVKRWKLYWFALQEEELCCYLKGDKSVLIEAIPLQGASVLCPCYDDPNVNIEVFIVFINI